MLWQRVTTCAVTAALLQLLSGIAAAQSPVITSYPSRVGAGPDYATDVLVNPWDFADPNDLSPFPDELSGWTNSATTARTTGRSAFLSSDHFVARTTAGGGNLIPLLFRGGADFITSASEPAGVFDHKAIPTAQYREVGHRHDAKRIDGRTAERVLVLGPLRRLRRTRRWRGVQNANGGHPLVHRGPRHRRLAGCERQPGDAVFHQCRQLSPNRLGRHGIDARLSDPGNVGWRRTGGRNG